MSTFGSRKGYMGRKVVNETGNLYERLTVIGYAGPDSQGGATWLCRCDCGQEKVVRARNLRSGRTLSCGCLRRDKICLPEGEAAFNALIGRAMRDAKRRGYEWALTKEEFRVLGAQSCHYCGAAPSNFTKRNGGNGGYTYSGLDRVDNDEGYVMSNVVPSCATCNRAKYRMTASAFGDWAERLFTHFVDNL